MRDETIQTLYGRVGRSILGTRPRSVGLAYLEELGRALETIWHAYRDTRVTVDYSAPGVAEAYRLHYLPHYAYTAYLSLEPIEDAVFTRAMGAGLRVGVFAAGPLPEVIAIVERCAAAGVERGLIRLSAYDIAAAAWNDSAERSVAIARDLSPGLEMEFRYDSIDLRAEPIPLPLFDIVLVQHCLNEICHDGEPTPTMLSIIASVAVGGGIALSDLTRYAASRTVPALEALLARQGFANRARFDRTMDHRTPFWRVPTASFFAFYGHTRNEAGGFDARLVRSRKNLKVSWSTWQRRR
jgi:SAM-dependent methyltransferase